MATTSNNDIARAIFLSLRDRSVTEQEKLLPEIVQFLFRKRFLSRSNEILSRLENIINKEKSRLVVRITSRDKLHENIKKDLTHILKEKYSVQEIELEEKIDEKLLGGFRIEVNDEVIDLTLKNKVIKLQEYLTKSL